MREAPRVIIERDLGTDVLDFMDKNELVVIKRKTLKHRNCVVRDLRAEVDHLTKKIESIQKGHTVP